MSRREEILKTAEKLRWDLGERVHDHTVEALHAEASRIAGKVIAVSGEKPAFNYERILDALVTNRWTGFPIMFLVLAVVFWITIEGANVPSSFLAWILLDTVHPALNQFGGAVGMPWWINGFLFDGVYLAMAWVVSVMLPPMAIFFPLFTLAEDFGYLPRVAFNLDSLFRKAGAHGKQALTMAMGYGCNAAAIVSTRIIDSPRERLIAILTNNFAICNGRWPTLILIATIFIGALAPPSLSSAVSSVAVVTVVVIGIVMTFVVSWGLSKTILKGEASFFSLELPPYRPPRIWQTLYTSVIDRTLIVLWRAVVWSVPAGGVIWLVSNIYIGDSSLAEHAVHSFDPVAFLFGLNGVILLAYIIAIPANEIVIPTVLMLTVLVTGMTELGSGAGVMFELESELATAHVLKAGGWTLLTGINLMLFSLLHNPCSTTLYTIYKETGSAKWTTLAALIPLAIAFLVCFVVTQLWALL
ncbi:MAG: ferrous iron transporter B [Ignavibacteriales bacterium]|nr:ferrous iron transporter B [Ignavibacteriales bacterium]